MNLLLKYGQLILVFFCISTFFYILKDFNTSSFKSLLANINYVSIVYTLVFGIIIILIKVFRLKIISEQFNYPINLSLAYKSQVISILFAMVTPGRVGEISKLYLLAENNQEKFPVVTSIIIFEILVRLVMVPQL